MNKYFSSLVAAIIVSFNTFEYLSAQISNEQTLQLISQETKNQEIKMEQYANPEYLYKIVSQEQWQESLLQNKIVPSSLDMDFIHLAKEDQISRVVQKFWNHTDHIILKLASKKLIGRLIYENNPGSTTKYYHLYDGNIPLDAVKDVTIVHIHG